MPQPPPLPLCDTTAAYGYPSDVQFLEGLFLARDEGDARNWRVRGGGRRPEEADQCDVVVHLLRLWLQDDGGTYPTLSPAPN